MTIIKLTKDNFSQQVVEFGFFSEQFPACFSSKMLTENLSEIMAEININYKQISKHSKNKVTSPLDISIYKNDISRRILSLPNPESFLRIIVASTLNARGF